MPQNSHLEIITAEEENFPEPDLKARNPEMLREKAEELARSLDWLPNTPSSRIFVQRSSALIRAFKPIFNAIDGPSPETSVSDDFRWLYDNSRLVYTELHGSARALRQRLKSPHVRTANGEVVPRTLAVAEAYLTTVVYEFSVQDFTIFVEAFQETTVLKLNELGTLVSTLKLAVLEQLLVRARQLLKNPSNDTYGVAVCMRSLRDVGQASWKDVLEPLMAVDKILQQDPAGSFLSMDRESRDLYRLKLTNIAEHSDCSEMEVAKEALALAQAARLRTHADPRVGLRESHIGYYLVDKGTSSLYQKVGFRPPFIQNIQGWARAYPEEFFLSGIEILTLAIMAVAVLFLTNSSSSPSLVLFSVLILLLTSSESAVQVMNYLVTALLPAKIMPKLNFSEGIPDECLTMVVVPPASERKSGAQAGGRSGSSIPGNHDPKICISRC